MGNSNKTNNSLTERQKMVLDYIAASIKKHGYPPTLREICKGTGINSTNGVSDHLSALKRKGYLKQTHLQSRGLTLIKPASRQNGSVSGSDGTQVLHSRRPVEERETIEVPILGRVMAGQPILAVEGQKESVRLDRFFLGPNTDVFGVRMTGDSMIEAGIHDNDIVFVSYQKKPNPGNIVLFKFDEEVSIRYFYPEAFRIRFQAAHFRVEPRIVRRDQFEESQILGVVIFVYRII